MNKKEFLAAYVAQRVKILIELRKDNNNLLKNLGSHEKMSLDRKNLKTKVIAEANEISKLVDWALLKSDEKAFRKQFIEKMMLVSKILEI